MQDKKQSELEVLVKKENIGKLAFEEGEYVFSYSKESQENFISLTMPVRTKSYINNQLHPVFEMHLPEGYLLSIIKKHFSKITKTDDFGLLKLISSNIKGRVSFKTNTKDSDVLTLDELISPKSETLFDELVSKFALTSALSGVQPKVMAKVQDKATLSLDDYIVKSWGDDYPNLALNEYFCMCLARYSNIDVPEFYISDDHKLFIMKRFDIKDDENYLGFEDMCVLQAKQRDDKYEGTYEQIVKTIKTFVSAQNKKYALMQFFKMMIINHFVQNGDGHLKNYGIIYDNIENIKLAPAYDIVCTTVYIKKDIPALHMLGSKKWWSKKYLLRFGVEVCDLTLKETEELYSECFAALEKVLNEIEFKIKKDSQKEFLTTLLDIFSRYKED